MQNIYRSLGLLDKRAIEKYDLNEDILMENAANSLHMLISKLTHKGSVIIVVCGGGNNGGDGYALARKLAGEYRVKIFIAKEPKSKMCQLQSQRAQEVGIEIVKKILPCDILVDCLFGSGFAGEMLSDIQKLISEMNRVGRIKIACDIPSGLTIDGNISGIGFQADYTISMGALKTALFSDMAKDYVGEVIVGDLGVGRQHYEVTSNAYLLEKSDMRLPYRRKNNVHKGNFGHLCVCIGQKSGAGFLSALAGLSFGAGLVSVMGEAALENKFVELMVAQEIPENVSAFAIGMGLGTQMPNIEAMLQKAPCVFDADIFYLKNLPDILERYSRLVLTPHLKEFLSLWRICGLKNISMEELSQNKIEILREFAERYPKIVILLKGANTLIAQDDRIYINPFGTPALAKGGSGDVLSGMIAALLAQGYDILEASISGSLAHSFAGRLETTSYALTPLKLIENIKALE